MNTRVENWNGYDIRFVEYNGEWWAVLKDICDALRLKSWHVAERLSPDMMERVSIDASNLVSKDIRSRGENKTRQMLVVNELGIYESLFASRRLEARKFRRWSATVLQKLRNQVGLEQYEVMRITNPDIQEDIDHILDTLFYDPETGKLMQSVTVAGGDVEQVVFE